MQKIIKLSDTHFIGVDNSEIKVGDIVAEKLLTGEYELFTIHTPNDIDEVRQKKVTHSNQPLENINFVDEAEGKIIPKIKPLSLSEVEEAVNGYSVDDGLKYVLSLPNSEYLSYEVQKMLEDAYNKGFNAHKELVKDKFLLTKEDLEKIFEAGRLDKGNNWYGGEFEQFFQSLLPRTEWECIIDEQGKLKLI